MPTPLAAARIACVIWLMLSGAPRAAKGQVDEPRFRADLSALAAQPRIIGSPGYHRAADYIADQISAIPDVELRVHEYPVMVPVTESATLDLGDGRVEKVYPFWPAQVRVNATPAEGITGRLVYCGRCNYEEIPPASVHGQIAVIEASAGPFWSNVQYMGARAIIILGTKDTTSLDLRFHDLQIPVNFPRLFVPPGELADALRAGAITRSVTLKASVNWRRKTARNYYALIKPRSPSGAPGGALMFSVPYDSSGLVPDLAFGASQATQAAAGLSILRDVAARPLNRPVVVFFGGGDSIQFLATRNMFLALSDVPAVWRKELDALAIKQKAANNDLARLRDLADAPEKLDVTRDRALIDRVAKLIETDLSLDQDELFRIRRTELDQRNDDTARREQGLVERQLLLNRIRYAFQSRPAQLVGELAGEASRYAQRTLDRLDGPTDERPGLVQQYAERERELLQRIDLYEWLARATGRNPDPSGRTNDSRLIELLVALDLSDRGTRVGPLYWGWFQRATNISQIQDYRDWFTRQERASAAKESTDNWLGPLRGVIDFEPLSGIRAPQSWLVAEMAIGSEMAQAWGVPGMSMITLDDPRPRRDTPTDTLDNVNVRAIVPQLAAVQTLFRHAWNDPRFKGPTELKWQHNAFEGQVVSAAPGRPVPDLPREGFLATYVHAVTNLRRIPEIRRLGYTMGVRRNEVRDTDNEGWYRFEGLPKLNITQMQMLAVQVYRAEPGNGAITATTDLGRQSADMKLFLDITQTLDPIRNVAFTCDEFSLTGLYDPRFLQTLTEVIPLDARRNAEPQRYNMLLSDGNMAGFIEPGVRAQLVFRYGRVGNRLILINMPPREPGQRFERRGMGDGFTAGQLNSLGPLALVTARDFWRLNDARIEEYRRAGVYSSLIDQMHAEAAVQLKRAEEHRAADRGAETMRDANGAWANGARVYSAVDGMARDVVRAAIFLLLLCVPFAFCMERLLIASANVYRQIAGILGIFAVMTAALWSFHPAFKISSSPLIIILAFAIILMSGVVIFVVYGKFDTELKRTRRGQRGGRGAADEAGFARTSVLAAAVALGIANMRKRKFRTALTAITIVLITFAVLAFTSATRYIGTTSIPIGEASAHPGVLLRQRGHRPMPETVVKNLRPLLAELAPRARIVERWWNQSSADSRDQLHLAAGGPSRVVPVAAVLGLSPGESDVSAVDEVIGKEAFARLERGEKNIIYLPIVLAQQAGARVGDAVRLSGVSLVVAGIFDANLFDSSVSTLGNEPLAPLNVAAATLDAGGRKMEDTAVESFDLGGGGASAAEAGGAYEHLSSSQYVVVPAAVARELPNASLRAIAIRLTNEAEVKRVTDELTKRLAVATFAGFDDGVRMVVAGNLSSVSGAGQVAVPLAIAGLIVFNTMMGSIAERRREIHVYTSLGLAPMHVGALFVAEALTYGLIGTVFGYVLGQGAATALLKLGWLGNVTLNYSGTSAILTMGLILLIVLASSLVPARIAARIAAPSIERSWKVPLPENGTIVAHLPFTINKTAADGALAYLAEYFETHQEGSIGKFSAGEVEPFTSPTEPAGPPSILSPARGLRTTIWLTPFDLGVRQRLTLLIHPGQQFADIYEVRLELQRLSGDDASWHRMNRTFLSEIRKQFLQWRTLTPQKMLAYVDESRKLFNA